MISKGQALPQSGRVLSGQHGIASAICIDGSAAAMALTGAFTLPAINPMIARTDRMRLSAFGKAMFSYLTGGRAEARHGAITIG